MIPAEINFDSPVLGDLISLPGDFGHSLRLSLLFFLSNPPPSPPPRVAPPSDGFKLPVLLELFTLRFSFNVGILLMFILTTDFFLLVSSNFLRDSFEKGLFSSIKIRGYH
jgi:hypothetical protein